MMQDTRRKPAQLLRLVAQPAGDAYFPDVAAAFLPWSNFITSIGVQGKAGGCPRADSPLRNIPGAHATALANHGNK